MEVATNSGIPWTQRSVEIKSNKTNIGTSYSWKSLRRLDACRRSLGGMQTIREPHTTLFSTGTAVLVP